jgi:sugar-specific transcriptional regulator TrmB
VSQEKLLKTLVDMGLMKLDAKVYVFLAKKGPQKAKEVARILRISKQQLYPSLRGLQSKGLVNATLEHPARFSAVPLEKALDLFVKAKMEEAKSIQQSKERLLSDWQSIVIQEAEDRAAKFTVIEGRKYVYSKIQQMIQETKKQLLTVTTVPSLIRADLYGLIDAAFNHPLRSTIHFRFLTEISEENIPSIRDLLDRAPKAGFMFKGRNHSLGLQSSPRMVIKDSEELLFFITPQTEDDSCLWTNCRELVQSFTAVFEELWRNSTEIKKTMIEIETLKTPITGDATISSNKYEEIIHSARNEIIIMTSAEKLYGFWKNMDLPREWSKRGVSVKIMAPITSKNLEAAKHLSKYVEVRHVPESYWETTIIDGKHLFQFKTVSHNDEGTETTLPLSAPFYTDDFDHVRKMANTLNEVWKTARKPSTVTLESIIGHHSFVPNSSYPPLKQVRGVTVFSEKQNKITEKDVLNKIIKADGNMAKKTVNEFGKMYASSASAIIHPPDSFNLPDMLIHVDHIHKRSWFGQGDALVIYLKHEMPERQFFVPAGGIGDNPRGVAHRREMNFTDKTAKENYRLVKKDELQIRVHGNTLFAGWTVPIKLFPKYVLPPACILIEGLHLQVTNLKWRQTILTRL